MPTYSTPPASCKNLPHVETKCFRTTYATYQALLVVHNFLQWASNSYNVGRMQKFHKPVNNFWSVMRKGLSHFFVHKDSLAFQLSETTAPFWVKYGDTSMSLTVMNRDASFLPSFLTRIEARRNHQSLSMRLLQYPTKMYIRVSTCHLLTWDLTCCEKPSAFGMHLYITNPSHDRRHMRKRVSHLQPQSFNYDPQHEHKQAFCHLPSPTLSWISSSRLWGQYKRSR